MRVHHHASEFPRHANGEKRTVLTIGTFDGVHSGHRAVLQQLREVADRHQASTTLLSFHPHPRVVLDPEHHGLQLLNTLEERQALLASTGLDHLVWVFGMFCAFAFPWLDRQLEAVESMPSAKASMAKLAIFGVALVLGLWWYYSYFALPKRDYNKVHPYTSFIPIFLYLVFRNLTEKLRKFHLHGFAWCGKITLETYILQFHVWMKTTGVNGPPRPSAVSERAEKPP